MARNEKSKLRQMIEKYGIKDMNDVHEFVKMLTAETVILRRRCKAAQVK